MRIVRRLAFAMAVALATPVLAAAQDHGKVGLTLGFPGDVGVLWHVSESVAIRPAFSFSHSSSDSPAGGASDGWGAGVDLAALLYVKKYDTVRVYLSPQFDYSHVSTSVTPAVTAGPVTTVTTGTTTTTTSTTGGGGAFGAQYTPTRHFSVYGELGVAYQHHRTDLPINSIGSISGSTWGSFAAVGVVFYP
jgi:hypothetical protein